MKPVPACECSQIHTLMEVHSNHVCESCACESAVM